VFVSFSENKLSKAQSEFRSEILEGNSKEKSRNFDEIPARRDL